MTTTTTTRKRRRRGAGSASAGLRLRRLIAFLSRNRLYRTAHTVERKTCVLFDAEHLRRMMLRDRWSAASAYALSFVDYRDCSRGADELNYRLLALRVLKAFAAGQARSVDYLFRRIYACLRFRPDRDRRIAIGRLLLALRSDDTKSSRLYGLFKPRAMQGIMDLVAKCPELNAKIRLPRYMSLVHTKSWLSVKNKSTSLPARILARSFLPKRPPQINDKKVSHKTNCSDAPSTAAFEGILSSSPTPAKMFPVRSTNNTATQATTQGEETEITKAPAAAASNLVAELHVPRQRRPNPQYIGPEWIV